jgi:protein-L-isoaspartate(D-aspartate) O-methyltransferase
MVIRTTDHRAVEREAMIQRQLKRRGIRDSHIIDAFREVRREAFISGEYGRLAYGDHPLPIESGQTISQPYIVALMIEAAEVKAGDTVLEVGAGSGYAAAVISRIAGKVIAVERQPALVEVARERMRTMGFDNVEIVEGDGSTGWPDAAPFDAIIAAATGSHVPAPLVEQLRDGGRLVMPIGDPETLQELIKVTKRPDGTLEQVNLGAVRFVPLVGEEGWSDAGA